jgi:hypothetical protein
MAVLSISIICHITQILVLEFIRTLFNCTLLLIRRQLMEIQTSPICSTLLSLLQDNGTVNTQFYTLYHPIRTIVLYFMMGRNLF